MTASLSLSPFAFLRVHSWLKLPQRMHDRTNELMHFFLSSVLRPLSISLFCLISPLISNAQAEGDYTYTVADGQATITGFNMSYSGPLSITNNLGGYPVTSIIGGFEHCEGLTVVTIPNSITNIGSYAFSGCFGMTSVTIPDSVISIGSRAFRYCPKLPDITIPDSVTSIGDLAFSACPALTAITVAQANAVYASSNGVLFNKNFTSLIKYPDGKTGAYTIPDSVTSIDSGAFNRCIGLTKLVIGTGMTSIGWAMLNNCSGLTSVTIHSGVTSIGEYAFNNSPALTSVLFQGAPPTLGGSSVFTGSPATIYYLPAFASHWPSSFGGRPTLCWNPTVQRDAAFGFASDRFSFNIAGTANIPVKVEATTNLISGVWTPVTNATLNSSGSLSFTDPASTSLPARFYRVVFP